MAPTKRCLPQRASGHAGGFFFGWTNAGSTGRQHPGFDLQIIVLALPRHFFLMRFEIADALPDFSLSDAGKTIGATVTGAVIGFDVSASACSAVLKATGKSGIGLRRLTSFTNAIVLSISASSSCCKFIMRAPPLILHQAGRKASSKSCFVRDAVHR
jgi:hypothetical protein